MVPDAKYHQGMTTTSMMGRQTPGQCGGCGALPQLKSALWKHGFPAEAQKCNWPSQGPAVQGLLKPGGSGPAQVMSHLCDSGSAVQEEGWRQPAGGGLLLSGDTSDETVPGASSKGPGASRMVPRSRRRADGSRFTLLICKADMSVEDSEESSVESC